MSPLILPPNKNFSGALRFCTNKKACYWGYLYIEYDFLSDFIYQDVYHSAVGVLDLEKLRERFSVGGGCEAGETNMNSKYVYQIKCDADESVTENYIQLDLLKQFVFNSHSQRYFSYYMY